MDRDDGLFEALAQGGRGAVLSHHDAARALGIELVPDDGSHHMTVPRNNGRPRCAGWTVHRADVLDVAATPDGLPVTGCARTLLDLSRVLATASAVAAADSALRLGLVEESTLRRTLAGVTGRGARGPRLVAGLMDPLSGSVLESLVRVLVVEGGIPAPRTQYEVRGPRGGLIARVDFCWPEARLVLEADGFAFHSDRAAFRHDRARLNQLQPLGWRVLHVTWDDVRDTPAAVVEMVRRCLTTSAASGPQGSR